MSGEWHRMSALALGAGIEGGAIDPRALTEFFLERIEEVDGDHAIYLRITAARARFALPTTLVWDSLDPGVETPARSSVERLRAAGCAIDETPVLRSGSWSAASARITPPSATRFGTTSSRHILI